MKYILFVLTTIFMVLIVIQDLKYHHVRFWVLLLHLLFLTGFFGTMRSTNIILGIIMVVILIIYTLMTTIFNDNTENIDYEEFHIIDLIYLVLAFSSSFLLRTEYAYVPFYYLMIPLIPAVLFIVFYKGEKLPFLTVLAPLITVYSFWALIV